MRYTGKVAILLLFLNALHVLCGTVLKTQNITEIDSLRSLKGYEWAGPCTKNPCQNGGICKDAENGYECQCPTTHTGKNCTDNVTPCTSSPCLNGGKCTVNGNGFTCKCVETYSGIICETSDPCSSNPCKNDGTCVADGTGFNCFCREHWIGETCEKSGPCSSNPCKNEGICNAYGTGFKCFCRRHWIGETCEKINPCSSNPCKNEGLCTVDGTGFACICFSQWEGETCEEYNPCSPNPCEHDGTCDADGTEFKCKCNGPWKGDTCEENCNCGEYTKSCPYDWKGDQICDCFPGYAEKYGYCEECNCGPYGSCSFQYGQKTCNCRPSAFEKNGVCIIMESTTSESTTALRTTVLPSTTQYCNCGEYSKSCRYNWKGDKTCDCFPGYAEKYGSCEECDCGPRGRCTLESGQKKCVCDPFTSERDGRCVDCNCGVNAQSCFYRKNGSKVCNCDVGYTQTNGYCSAICSEEKCMHGKCEIMGNGFKCRCNEGFTGQRCEEKIQIKSNKLDIGTIMLLTVAFAIFILLSGMFCSLRRILNKISKK